MLGSHLKNSVKVAKDRLIQKVNDFNAVKLELIQSIEKFSANALQEVQAVLEDDGEDRRRFHELYGNANKEIEACMFKLLEIRDAWNNDSGDEQHSDHPGNNDQDLCEQAVKNTDVAEVGARFPKNLPSSRLDDFESSSNSIDNNAQNNSMKPQLPRSHGLTMKTFNTLCTYKNANEDDSSRILSEVECNQSCRTLKQNMKVNGLEEMQIKNKSEQNICDRITNCNIQVIQKLQKEVADKGCSDSNFMTKNKHSYAEPREKDVNNDTVAVDSISPSADIYSSSVSSVSDGDKQQFNKYATISDNFPKDCTAKFLPNYPIEFGHMMDGIITHTNSPVSFYFHILTADYNINMLHAELSQYYADPSRPALSTKPIPGTLCVAIPENSSTWMRAVVETESYCNTQDPSVTVRFADFGFTEIHPLSHLREINDSFLQIPCLAIHCRLRGIDPPPPQHDWNETILALFRDLPFKQEVKAKAVGKIDHQYEVELFRKEMNIDVSIADCLLASSLTLHVRKYDSSPTVTSNRESPQLSDANKTKICSYLPESVANNLDRRRSVSYEHDEKQKHQHIDNNRELRHYYEGLMSDNSYQNEEPACLQIQDLELPQNFTIEAMLANVVSPDEFYIHPVSEEVACIDLLTEDLNNTYATSYPLIIDTNEIPVGSFWCAKFSVDGLWYRAKVLYVEQAKRDIKTRKAIMEPVLLMFFVDYGDSAWLTVNDIRPLEARFYSFPALAVKCRLFNVLPASNTADNRVSSWSPEVALQMEDWACNQVIKIRVYRFQDSAEGKLYEVSLWNLQEDSAFHEELLKLGLAKTNVIQNSEPIMYSAGEFVSSHESIQDYEITELESWNPMHVEYSSLRNSYKLDVDDAGVALTGYKARDEKDICMFYLRGQLCKRGNYCPYKHIRPRRDGQTTDTKDVILIDNPIKIPVIGNSIPVEVTSLNEPFNFFVNFLLSSERSYELGSKSDDTYARELCLLWEAMQKHYGNKPLRDGDYLLRSEGELVAAKFSEDNAWYRGRVIEVSPEYSCVKIFFVDYAGVEWVPEENIRDLKVEFTHLPCQAVECRLANIEFFDDPSLREEARKFFRRQIKNKNLIAYIIDVVGETMFIDLFNVNNETAINIALAMVNAGFAKHQYTKQNRVKFNHPHTSEAPQYLPA